MKRVVFTLLIFFTCLSFSQNQNSLLWKISGNGLEKDSYLFGTMHVSERIAFHLDDVFFESLMKSDYVALESNPELWLEHSFESGELLGNFNVTNSTGRNFYNSQFRFNPPKMQEVSMFLSREHYLLNGILYRTSPMMQDFQEDTYLDMFIFQSGRKFDKEVVGLEDIERSSNLVKKATDGRSRKPSPDLWLQKRMKDEDFYTMMTNSYRDRNIFFLDSLNKAIYSENYMEHMLYIRNEDMARGIDSLAKLGSTFSAVGAAHLAGEKGVIEKLRNRGYTVTPLLSEKTQIGKDIKEKIEVKEAQVSFDKRTSSDGFFSVKSPSKLYEMGAKEFTIYLSPNIGNGAYHTIARINLMSEFGGEVKSLDDIDKLLFENVPGTIISKKKMTDGVYPGLDIVNKTKIGDYQRYHIFMTPIEVIVFKMAGKRDYVLKRGDAFFESINFLNTSNELVKVTSKNKGFEIQMPKFHTFNNFDERGNRFIQSLDGEGNYYFMKEVVLNDLEYLEEDDFELKRIHERFYKNMKLELDEGRFVEDGKQKYYISKSKESKEKTFAHLKTVIKGQFYYLIGKISKDTTEPSSYFDSFQLNEFTYDEKDFEVRKDTSLLYSVNTVEKPSYGNDRSYRSRKKKYLQYTKTSNFYTKANERIFVKLKKFHDWDYYKNIDSLWSKELKKYRPSKFSGPDLSSLLEDELDFLFERRKLTIKDKKTGKDNFGNESMSLYLTDSLSNRAIKVKYVFSHGRLFTLKTVVDKRYKETKFVTEFYDTFQPEKPEKELPDLFKSKVNVFVEALKKGDSIAIESYDRIDFDKTHESLLIDLIKDDSFDQDQRVIQDYLISELSEVKTIRVERFLDALYQNSFENPYSQIAILKSLLKDKSKKSYERFLKLLESDVPITNKKMDIYYFYRNLKDSLSLTREMYPQLMKYSVIDQYKDPVYSLLTDLLDKDLIKPKKYKKYKDQMLTETRIELKKQLSKTLSTKKSNLAGKRIYNNSYGNSDNSDLLEQHTKLLMPFIKDEQVKKLLSKIQFIDNQEVKATYVSELAKINKVVPQKIIDELLKTHKGHFALFRRLNKMKRLDVLPKEYASKEKVYESFVLKGQKLNLEKKDSVMFVGKRDVQYKEKDFEVYFYKVKKESKYTYASPKWKLHFAVLRKDGDKIQVKSLYTKNNQYIDVTEPLDKQLDTYVEKFQLKDRKRVFISVRDDDFFGYY